MPTILAAEKPLARYQLIMTTNYDDLLERAFDEGRQDYDLVWYQAQGLDKGRFRHKGPERANEYAYPFFQQRPAITEETEAACRTRPFRKCGMSAESPVVSTSRHSRKGTWGGVGRQVSQQELDGGH
jgi:hypothetical protein